MKLAVSNIAWLPEQDSQIYRLMATYGFTGLEIAPTRIFPSCPYDRLLEARQWAGDLKTRYDFTIPSIQSIWYGRQENLFGSEEERKILLGYMKRAMEFAEVIGCRNMVFGCPRNRVVPDSMLPEEAEFVAKDFFQVMGDYAASRKIVVGIEANPKRYGTNYINTTREALKLICRVGSRGFRLNLDVGTIIQNGECANELIGNVKLISHVHVSEPDLSPVEARRIHRKIYDILSAEGYTGFISIEMGRQKDIQVIERSMYYVREIFGDR